MDEINFLSNKEKETDRGKDEKKKNEEQIIWSKPTDDLSKDHTKSSSGWFAIFNKDKSLKKAKRPIDQSKLKKSRREVLELIKQHEKYQKIMPREKKEAKFNFFSWLNRKIKKLDYKEILIDYQGIFNKEKEKRKLSKAINLNASQERKVESELEATTREKTKLPPQPQEKISRESRQEKENIEQITSHHEKADQEKEGGNPEILQTNLIKGEIVTFFDRRQKITNLISAIIIPCLIIALAYIGIIFLKVYNETSNIELTERYNNLEQQIKQSEKDLNDILSFQKKLKIAGELIAKHVYWTNFFKFLEDSTISDVYYVDFSGDTRGSYTLNAVSKNYNNISEQLEALKENSKVSEIKTKGGQIIQENNKNNKGGNVNFNLELTIDPRLFTE